jgi:hypothetical protein
MPDPRLNSVHLNPDRRQDYRRAREALLQRCGSLTLFNQDLQREQCSGPSGMTAVHGDGSRPASPPGAGCWLAARDLLYPLGVGVNTLGRSSDNDIVVDDAFASRRHCVVLVHSDHTCELHDTASKNGTFVNGVRVTASTPLHPGDEVRICGRTFLFMTASSSSDELEATLGG